MSAADGGGLSQLFLFVFAEPISAFETFEISATILTIFFLLFESAAVTIGESFTPNNLLLGESEVLHELGEACLRPDKDACLYLNGTTIASSFDVFWFSLQAAIKLGTTHLDDTEDADLFPYQTDDGSLSAATPMFFFPTDTDLLDAARDENL